MSKRAGLNIFCYGNDDLSNIIQTMNHFVEKNDNEIEYSVSNNSEETWKYFIFKGEINEKKNEVIKKMIKQHFNDKIYQLIKDIENNDENRDKNVKEF